NADGEEDAPATLTTTHAATTTSTSASVSTSATTSTSSPSSSTTATLVTLPQVQYIVGSIHHVRGIPIDFSEELYMKALQEVGEGSWETLFKVFFDEQFEMIKGLEPEVVGHLDLVRIFFVSISGGVQEGQGQKQGQLTEELWELVKRNVDYVIGYGGLFELNSRAWKKGLRDAYPQRDILE
ncbi:histidinolphosphatase, partial [Dissophora globulifera]